MKLSRTIAITCLIALSIVLVGCKKSSDKLVDVRISYVDVRPQKISENDTAWITVMVNNLSGENVLIKILSEQGITNPQITSTRGNPVYIEYFPPDVPSGKITEVNITVIVTAEDGQELDRAEARILVDD